MNRRHRPHRKSILRHKDMLHRTKRVTRVEIRRSPERHYDATKRYIMHRKVVKLFYWFNAFSNSQKGLEKCSKKSGDGMQTAALAEVPGELGGYPKSGGRKNPHMGISWGPKKLIWVYFGGDGGGVL